jgi:hypothetical protein
MGTQQMILLVAAAVIAGIALFVLASIQERGQEAAVDAVQYAAAKEDLHNVVDMMERDLRNMGASMYFDAGGCNCWVGASLDPINVLEGTWYDSSAVTGGTWYRLKFYTQTDSLTPPDTVRYVWRPAPGAGTVTLRDGTVRTIQRLERYQGGALTGWSDDITLLRVRLRQPETQPTLINLSDARTIDVTLRTMSPLGMGDVIEETRFDATYRPVAMTITDNLPN